MAGRVSPGSEAAQIPAGRAAGPARPARLALAAAVAAFALAASLIFLKPDWLGVSSDARPEAMLLATANGEMRETQLPDGSRILLDSGTRIEVRYSRSERSLALSAGRARFRVAHDLRPFVVRAGTSAITATGTLFDVSLVDGRAAVLLLEGSVEVRSQALGQRTRRLEPGQKLALSGTGTASPQLAAPGEAAWPRQMLEFADTPLEQVAAMANRHSRVKLELGGGPVAKLRVTGAFRRGDVEGLARSLAATFGLRMEVRPNGNFRLVDPDAPGS